MKASSRSLCLVGLLTAATLLTGCGTGAPGADPAPKTASSGYPVTISSCGFSSTITAKPRRAVTLDQGATDVALALGLGDQLVGTAYLDDVVPDKWKAVYDSIPVLAKEYPTHERLLAARPDFVYASYASAFDPKVAGTQSELAAQKVGFFLSVYGCDDKKKQPPTSFEGVWGEIDSIAKAFGVPERAAAIRTEQEKELARLRATDAGKGVRAFWYDSGTKTPYVGVGNGGPQLVLDAVGATNVFADVAGTWANGSWEKVVAADPDVIVLADASWDSAAKKIAYLEKDPVLRKLRAVREKRFVTLPFSESTPGVRLVDGAASVSEQLAKLG